MPMPTDRNRNYSPFYALLAVLVMICLSTLSKCGIVPTMNDIAEKMELRELETAFNTIQHPGGTERVDLQKTIGRLTGQSRNCDIFIGEMRSYDGERDPIMPVYAGQIVQRYGEPRVIFIEDQTIPVADNLNLPAGFNNLSRWNVASASLEQPILFISSFVTTIQRRRSNVNSRMTGCLLTPAARP